MKIVLVIEDDRSMRNLLKMRIEEQGFDVKTWPKGLRSFNAIDECNPDFVLTDYDLGEGPNGLDIALYAQNKNIPVLLMSGNYKNRFEAFKYSIPFIEKIDLNGIRLKQILSEV